jgi:hypothetical protein
MPITVDEARQRWLTFLLGAGGSATASLFSESFGIEGSAAIALSSGPDGIDVGLVIVTGVPIDEFWLAANVGADVFVGGLQASLTELEDPGEAINLVIGPVIATGISDMKGDVGGGIIGVGVSPLPAGFSVTRTRTRVYSYRGAIDIVATWFCKLDRACQAN